MQVRKVTNGIVLAKNGDLLPQWVKKYLDARYSPAVFCLDSAA